MNLTHPAWLEHDMNTTSWSWTWLILPDWSIAWIQLPVFMACSSQAGWVKFMNRKLYNCHAGVWQDESSSWLGSCTWIQLPCYELDSSCLTQAWHEYNFLAMNLTHPAWLEHDMNTTTWSWTWLILSDWSMTIISSWSCSCIHGMLQSGRMSEVYEQEVV
jgi:hypothetical protein